METFAEKVRSSRDSLAREGQELLFAGRRFGDAIRDEADGWRTYVRDRAVSAVSDVRALPVHLESRLLSRASARLDRLERSIEERLALLAEGPVEPEPPLEGYEALTAKDIVSRLDTLEPEAVRALIAFEQAHKGRTTVLRAANERLAA